ncbi:MAG: hypothetical protein LBR25_07300 [Erysipelotrichaceae bacterium]|jgi:hypothetical protein|nr:hypothetical protein [Erysipelotrichaceae bacterium]
MKITNIHLDDMLRCYATSAFQVDNQLTLFYASEEEGYPCYSYTGKNFQSREVVWQQGGGCMSILPVPDKKNEFLAILDFYLKVSPSKARLVWGRRENGKWVIKDLLHLPFLHRFGVFEIDGVLHFLGSTIADDKDHKEDWSTPGSLYTGIFPDDFNEGLKVEKLDTGYFRNHGFTKHKENGKEVAYISCDQGVFRIILPYHHSSWKIEPVLTIPCSEIAIGDIDQDGEDEIITIEPFHGNQIRIFKKQDNEYQSIYTYGNPIDFAHTLAFTTLRGIPTFLAGVRRRDCELVGFQYRDNKIESFLIDQGGGPANLFVVNQPDYDLILSASHTRNEAELYVIE